MHLIFLGREDSAPFSLCQRLKRLLVLDTRPIVELEVEAEDLAGDLAILQCTAIDQHRLTYKPLKQYEHNCREKKVASAAGFEPARVTP